VTIHQAIWSYDGGDFRVDEHEHLFGFDLIFSALHEGGGYRPVAIIAAHQPTTDWERNWCRRAVIARCNDQWNIWHSTMESLATWGDRYTP